MRSALRWFCVVSSLGLCACVAGLAVARVADDPSAVVVDRAKRTVTIDAKVAPRKIDDPRYKEVYPIEVIACWAFPKGQKAHETVVTVEAKPSAVHKALIDLGLKPGRPVVGAVKEKSHGPEVRIYLEIPQEGGEPRRVPIEKTLLDPRSNKPMPKVKWLFTGSALEQPDPNKDEKVYGADQSGTLIAIFPVTDKTVFQTNLTWEDEKFVKLETDKKVVPKEGTPVKLVIEVPEAK
jgi:hypothetical protein